MAATDKDVPSSAEGEENKTAQRIPMNSKYILKLGMAGVVLCVISLLTGCNAPAYTRFENIDATGWDNLRCVEFRDLPDSAVRVNFPDRRYDMVLVVRCNSRADSLITLQVEQTSLRAGVNDYIMKIVTREGDGTMRGKPHHGIYTYKYILNKDWVPEEGYSISFQPELNKKLPEGITNIGVVLEKSANTDAIK